MDINIKFVGSSALALSLTALGCAGDDSMTSATLSASSTSPVTTPTTTGPATTDSDTTTEGPTTMGPGTDTQGVACVDAEECEEGEFCAQSGVCLPDGSCEVDSDCGGDEVCDPDGLCVPRPPCSSDTDCDAGEVCTMDGDCIPEGTCTGDEDCPGDEYCNNQGNCLPMGACQTTSDCPEGMLCTMEGMCEPGGFCGTEEFGAEPVSPELLLVLDRSCSMKNKIMGVKKWDIAVEALVGLTTAYEGQINWGLTLFPDKTNPGCEQDEYPVPLGPNNELPIQSLLINAQDNGDLYYPNGPCVTNIDTAVEQASMDPALFAPDSNGYVMLITDGSQAGCNKAGGANGAKMILADMFAMGVPTYVVGFGGAVNENQLNDYAENGGVPLPGDPKFYKADDALELEQAFADIVGSLVSCEYQLGEAPPDWNDVVVFFNDVLNVPFDPNNMEGWNYDPNTNTITFYGSYCDSLKNQEIWDIDVVFDCDAPTPE